jgi:GNAT superfamily N-acetyltransferase
MRFVYRRNVAAKDFLYLRYRAAILLERGGHIGGGRPDCPAKPGESGLRRGFVGAFGNERAMASELQIVIDTLPAGFNAIQTEARGEDYLFVDRLAADWMSRSMRFDRPGEVLLATRVDGVLAGIGGLTVDPVVPGALRMRRFYVRKPYRRLGTGRMLAAALLEHARKAGRQVVTVNAAPASILFWEALGFLPDPRHGHSHIALIQPVGSISVILPLREPPIRHSPGRAVGGRGSGRRPSRRS